MNELIKLIPTLGFPIVCAIAMGVFIVKIYKDSNKQHTDDMAAVQARCKEREEKLYKEIEENRKVNAKAIETIAHYAEKLDSIQSDIHDIKQDLTIIKIKEGCE